MAYFTLYFAILIEGSSKCERLFLLLPFQSLHFVQNFCINCEALLYFVFEEKCREPSCYFAVCLLL